jgi:hypothetical protein
MRGRGTSVALPIDPRLQAMDAVIHGVIPGSEVRLFGSRARGTAGPESDIDLLITAPDDWLEGRHWRSHVIGRAIGRDGCWMVLSEPEGLLRIAAADLETAEASSDQDVFRPGPCR